MLRSLFCAAAIFSLVLSICLFPQTASARRCGGEVPETLLSLYQNSDAIYIASFDKLVEGKISESDENYSVQEIKKHFTISSTLKGASRKFFVLDDQKYIHKNTVPEAAVESAVSSASVETEAAAEEFEPEEEGEEGEVELKSGDTLLLFTKGGAEPERTDKGDGDEEETPKLADYRDGLKKLSMDEIGVYEARIKELNSIFAAKKVSEKALLEWVIRCAEHPVTRWEGTFELLQSVRDREWKEEEAEQRRERIAKGEPVEEAPAEADEMEPDDAEQKAFDTSVFARILDANDKQRLANLLFQRTVSAQANGERPEPIAGDNELLELVKRWGDPRLIGFLLDKLRAGADEPYTNANTMSTVAEVLGDSKAGEIASRYEEHAYESDDAIVDTGEEPEAMEANDAAAAQGENPAGRPEEADAPETEGDEPVVRKRTYGDVRRELMQQFLARCDLVIAAKELHEESEIKSTR